MVYDLKYIKFDYFSISIKYHKHGLYIECKRQLLCDLEIQI